MDGWMDGWIDRSIDGLNSIGWADSWVDFCPAGARKPETWKGGDISLTKGKAGMSCHHGQTMGKTMGKSTINEEDHGKYPLVN